MASSYLVLGQSNPGATTLTAMYTVPALTSAVVSTINVCNRSATATTFRVSIAIAGAGDTNAQYLAYDAPIGGNAVIPLTIGVTLATTDVIRVYATLATLTFQAFGTQIT